MSRIPLIGVALLLGALSCAAEPPEYLEKIDKVQPGKYGDLLSKYLLVTPGDFGRVVLMPSFKTETSVSVYSVPLLGPNTAGATYRVTVIFAEDSLWQMAQSYSSAANARVSRHDLDIDADLAFAVQRAWWTILSKDPIPTESPDITFDGTISVFSVVMPDGKTVIREAANPRRPPATELVGAGIDLWGYATAPEEERKTRKERLMQTLRGLAESNPKP